MSQRTSRERSTSSRTNSRSKGRANVAATSVLRAEAVVKGLEGLVQSLGELRAEAMRRAVGESIGSQKERTNMPNRTLTATAALEDARKLRDIKSRLANEEDLAAKEVSDIRDRVKLPELQTFDDKFDEWLKE